MRKKIVYLLKLAGLKEAEIKIYLLILKLKHATIPELVLKMKINPMMVYRMIDALFERKLIEVKYLNDKQKIVSALSFQALIKKINKTQKKLRRLELALKGMNALLPFLDWEKEEEKEEELIELKEGLDAFREEYLVMPDVCREEYLHVGSMQNYWDTAKMSYDDPFERAFIRKRMQKGIYARVMNLPSQEMEKISKNDSKEKRTTRLQYNLPIMKNYLAMAENQVSYFVCEKDNPQVIVIRQPELVEMYKSNFGRLWGN